VLEICGFQAGSSPTELPGGTRGHSAGDVEVNTLVHPGKH
jgi:hypothetical protein